MLARLFLLFTIIPFIELFLLLQVGDVVGFWPTFAMIIVTGIVGAWLAKREGLRVLREYQKAIEELRMPEEGLTSALLVVVGGALMIAPGVMTDVIGILLMIPPIRRVVAGWVEAYVKKTLLKGGGLGGAGAGVGKRGGVTFRQVRVGPDGVVRETVKSTVVETTGEVTSETKQDDDEAAVLEPDLVVDRRGRVVARLED